MAKLTWRPALKVGTLTLLLLALGAAPGAIGADDSREPDLGDCQILKVEAGNKVHARAYAEGVQIYMWSGSSWTFIGPEAMLYDQDGDVVGIHYAGPTWESNSGSKVKAAVSERCTPNPDAIPWLLLKAVSSEGPGIFNGVTFIQRVNTTGGLAPAYAGDYPGEIVEVPYTADYYFYRAQ